MSATAGEALLSKCTLIWIGRDARKFEEFKHSDNVLPLLKAIKAVVQHPDPCFPKTWTHPQTGRRVVTAVELGDCMTDECWRKAMWEPASTGALQSHRRAWHIADLYDRTAWCMIIEDDITLRANAVDQLEFVFGQIATNRAQCLMLNFVPGASAQHQNHVRDHCRPIARHSQHTEIREYPFQKGRNNQLAQSTWATV